MKIIKLKEIQWIENCYVRLSLCFFMGNPINLFIYGSSGDQATTGPEESSLEPAIKLLIGLISFFLLIFGKRFFFHELKYRNLLVWLITILVLCSTAWSGAPDITLRRSILLLGATIFGTYFSCRFSFKQQITFLAWAFGAIALMSFMIGAFVPSYGVMRGVHQGAWRGVYLHKNMLGIQMSLSTIFFLAATSSNCMKRYRGLLMFFLAISLFLVIASQSTTNIVASFALITAFLAFRILRLKMDFLIPVVLLAILFLGISLMLLLPQTEALFNVFGKDTTLTGRDELWYYLWELIKERPFFGYGYEAFWKDSNNYSLLWQLIGWSAPHAHNGLLEVFLSIGFVGGLIYLSTFALTFLKSIRLIRIAQGYEYFFPALFLLHVIFTNATENNVLSSDGAWVLYVWACMIPIALTRSNIFEEHVRVIDR